MEDLDHEAVDRLGINFIKTVCDEAGFSVDQVSVLLREAITYDETLRFLLQKYKTPQPARATILVTSNFTIPFIIPDGKGIEENKAALMRRFYHVRIDAFLRFIGVKLLPKEERCKLNKDGNNDVSKLFISWDYMQDAPLCTPIQSPEFYRQAIRDIYYI